MTDDRNRPVGPRRTVAANDKGPAASKIDAAAMRIARLLGWQIAREEFERRSAANDNRPVPDADEEYEANAMTKVALYARYSSDSQSTASIEDQFRLCRERA